MVLLASVWAQQHYLCAMVRHNDYTKANKSFDSRYRTDTNRNSGKTWNSSSKTFQKKNFQTDASNNLDSKRANLKDSLKVEKMNTARNLNNSERFTSPELRGFDSDYRDSAKEWANQFADKKDLSKDYKGTIDFKKRGKYADYLKEAYGDMNERSLQDLNKYDFRSSRDKEAGIPKTKAGGQLQNEEKGFFESIFGDEEKRERVRFLGTKNRLQTEKKIAETTELPTPHAPNISKEQTPAKQDEALTTKTRKGSSVIEEKQIDEDVAKRMRLMRMPDHLRGKATIKVKVQDDL